MEKAKHKELPESINIVNHVSGRIRELRKIYNDVSSKKSEMLIHQMLPNFMRRRAMSHNPKRLPQKYRKIHTSQMAKSGLENSIRKRLPRKYRRRPSNLLAEYTRRSQLNVWLETHIWHAKRFKMREMWGYKIPYTPTDKRYKASYRAAKQHCLLQDISFYPCIEISGPFEILSNNFKRVIDNAQKPTISGRCFVNGTREGKCTIFKIDSYPYDAICEASFLWQAGQEDSHRTLWIFSHPAANKELLDEFAKLFNFAKSRKNVETFFSRNPKYEDVKTGVTIVDLKDTMNRFRLTGTHSNTVLAKSFKTYTTTSGSNWLQQLCIESEEFQKSHLAQMEIWDEFKLTNSPLEWPLHSIINLNIEDPRITRNNSIKRGIRDESKLFANGSQTIDVPKIISYSSLWNKELRDSITNSKITNSELDKIRYKKQLIPSIPTSFEKNMLQPIPILIIQQPNESMSGWDIIVPSGYGLGVWLSLIKFGAKAGGWHEYEMVLSEMGKEVSAPDTVLGNICKHNITSQLRKEYFRKPPNKRTNYSKLGIVSPFSCPFQILVNEWNGENTRGFFVLRDSTTLDEVSKVLSLSKSIHQLRLENNALIPVKIQMMSSGAPSDYSILCLPSKKDIKYALMTNHQNTSALQEKIHHDPNEHQRKVQRFAHKKLLKRLKNKRVRERRKQEGVKKESFEAKFEKNVLKDMHQKNYEEMCNMWLPAPTSVRHQCSREVIGYVTKSRFTFSLGKVSSIGYITSTAFKELMKKFENFTKVKPFLLIRSPDSTCYYTAKISI